MTRTQPSASPTTSRAWRAIAALMFSLVLAPAAMADEPATQNATPAAAVAPAPDGAAPATPAAAPTDAAAAGAAPIEGQADDNVEALVEDNSLGMAHDLSPWGMYQNADIVVKIVMIGLAIASLITWTIWIAKGFELLGAKRRLRSEIALLKKATSIKHASETADKPGTLAHLLVHDALEEMHLSANAREKEGIKERVSFRLERLVAVGHPARDEDGLVGAHVQGERGPETVPGAQVDPRTQDAALREADQLVPRLRVQPAGDARLGVEAHVVLDGAEVGQPEPDHLGPLPVLLEPAAGVTVQGQVEDEESRDRSGVHPEVGHGHWPVFAYLASVASFMGRHQSSFARYQSIVAASPSSNEV